MLEIKKVTLSEQEIEKKISTSIDNPAEREKNDNSCWPMYKCCPNTGWR